MSLVKHLFVDVDVKMSFSMQKRNVPGFHIFTAEVKRAKLSCCVEL